MSRSSSSRIFIAMEHQENQIRGRESAGWLSPRKWFQWVPTSPSQLEKVESKILNEVKNISEKKFVPVGKNSRLWTIVLNKELQEEEKNNATPIVMVHGFGGGVGLWVNNLDGLSTHRTVYAFDLLGFGRSSRNSFNRDPSIAETEFVDSFEEWRKKLNLEKFILLGHSFGGFLACAYAMKYPEGVKHLILADPWGFPEKPPPNQQQRQLPSWIRLLATMLKPFNPLAGLRAAGPMGPSLVKRFRPDLRDTFSEIFEDDTISSYIYHCNAQTPSGESAFRSMQIPFGWARFPMINRISDIPSQIPITFIYGSRSWVDGNIGYRVRYIRNDSFVDIQNIQGAGHHVYADKPDIFNKLVCRICDTVDGKVAPTSLRRTQSMTDTGRATEDRQQEMAAH